jgi:hypothetical protein
VLPPPRPLQPGNNVEETRRNRPAFDFIINNNLYKVTGLQAAFAKFAADRMLLSFPSDAIEVKANWFPVESPGDPSKSGIPGYTGTPNDADRSYHVATGRHSSTRIIPGDASSSGAATHSAQRKPLYRQIPPFLIQVTLATTTQRTTQRLTLRARRHRPWMRCSPRPP